MDLPETVYSARIFGNYVYEWSKEDGMLRRREKNRMGVAKIVSHVTSPSKIDSLIRQDYFEAS